jgi:flagellar biosynthesis anti-sigma factor FlgM
MTNPIGSLSSGSELSSATSQTQASAPAKPVATATKPGVASAQKSEAVTVSADSQSSSQLLNAARGADGIDTTRVAQLRSSIQNGTYNVSPEDLAKAIGAAATSGHGLGASP